MDDTLAFTSDLADMPADEDAARGAREQYRETGIPTLEPDRVIRTHLRAGERVLGVRARATFRRIDESSGVIVRAEGVLYVTDRRLLHLGSEAVSIPLSEIDELTMAEDRILVTLEGARGITLDAIDPRQLRVLITAAKAAARGPETGPIARPTG